MKKTRNGGNKFNVLYVIILILIVIIVPFIISVIFKFRVPWSIFSAEWTPDGYLGYIGSLIGATATIYAVRVTIINERKQQDEERVIAAKPWLSSENHILNSNDDIKREENGMTIFVELKGDLFGRSVNVPWEIKNGIHEINKEDCVIKYEIENAGGNTATQLQITLNGLCLFPEFALAKDRKKTFVFVLPARNNEKRSVYVLDFRYGDVVSTTLYAQKEIFNIVKYEHGVACVQSTDDLLTAPQKENDKV